jgi:hypothetical protein
VAIALDVELLSVGEKTAGSNPLENDGKNQMSQNQ